MLKVISSEKHTAPSGDEGYLNKLQGTESRKTVLGTTSSHRVTFYHWSEDQMEVDAELDITVAKIHESFDVVDREFVTEDGEAITLKYIYAKP